MSIYHNIYNLIVKYIYGGVQLTEYMELTTVLLSTAACLIVFAIPFIIVLLVIKLVCGGLWKW